MIAERPGKAAHHNSLENKNHIMTADNDLTFANDFNTFYCRSDTCSFMLQQKVALGSVDSTPAGDTLISLKRCQKTLHTCQPEESN